MNMFYWKNSRKNGKSLKYEHKKIKYHRIVYIYNYTHYFNHKNVLTYIICYKKKKILKNIIYIIFKFSNSNF